MNEKNRISNFKNGNLLDIETIITEYSGYLFKVIKNMCPGSFLPNEDIEEIILDVFVAIWKNTEKLDEGKDIKPYLSSIAHNLTKKRLSEINKNINLVEIDEEKEYSKESWSEVIENRLKIEEIDYILKELSEEEYLIFTNFYYYSKKTKEIAKELNISDVKVKTKLHRIRNKIKKKFKERGYSNEGIK